jgi:hypothetical protein
MVVDRGHSANTRRKYGLPALRHGHIVPSQVLLGSDFEKECDRDG